jgi:cell division protein ZapA
MPEVSINVGGREYTVACQEGEEHFLQSAARMLDAEAALLLEQIGRLPESRVLLMAGLMLADKTAGLEDQLREAEARLKAQAAEIEALKHRPAPEPQRIEVPVLPAEVSETMAELAARAEALADRVEEAARKP